MPLCRAVKVAARRAQTSSQHIRECGRVAKLTPTVLCPQQGKLVALCSCPTMPRPGTSPLATAGAGLIQRLVVARMHRGAAQLMLLRSGSPLSVLADGTSVYALGPSSRCAQSSIVCPHSSPFGVSDEYHYKLLVLLFAWALPLCYVDFSRDGAGTLYPRPCLLGTGSKPEQVLCAVGGPPRPTKLDCSRGTPFFLSSACRH